MTRRTHYGAREIGRLATACLGDHDDALESVATPVPWVDLPRNAAGKILKHELVELIAPDR